MPDQQQQKPAAPFIERKEDSGGPKDLSGDRPDTKNILRKIKSIAPDQAKKYKQRTGQGL
jgi:hypothetical protein